MLNLSIASRKIVKAFEGDDFGMLGEAQQNMVLVSSAIVTCRADSGGLFMV